jgi:type IV secretion system protein VirB6
MNVMHLLHAAEGVGDFFYYALIYKFVQSEILGIGPAIMSRMMNFVGALAMVLMTIWILFNGFRIVSGQSRDSMMVFVMNAARSTFIVAVATTMTLAGSDLQTLLTENLDRQAVQLITGEDDKRASDLIEKNLVLMQLALSSIDMVNISEDGSMNLSEQKTRALWMVGLGAGGPPVVAGVLLLMYQVAMALFIGFGPLFILFLMFDSTKQMFWKWLNYGVGTLFSMAVLALMTSLALKVVGIVTATFWLTSAFGGGDLTAGMGSRALQQGGIGLLLTLLLISVPPIASNFFQGALGGFMAYSQFGQGVGHRPGEAAYRGGHSNVSVNAVNRSHDASMSGGLKGDPQNTQASAAPTPISTAYAPSSGAQDRVKLGAKSGDS